MNSNIMLQCNQKGKYLLGTEGGTLSMFEIRRFIEDNQMGVAKKEYFSPETLEFMKNVKKSNLTEMIMTMQSTKKNDVI